MITVLYGKNDFAAHEALAALRETLDTDGQLADNTVRIDGAAAKPEELLAICQTVPFLGSRRLVIVDGVLARFASLPGRGRRRAKTGEDSDPLGKWSDFVAALPALPETTALVFLDGDLKPQNPLLRALSALGGLAEVRECKPLAQADVAGWIVGRAPRYGVALEPRAVAALAGLVGSQLWVLDGELRKLAVYAGDRRVTEEEVRTLVSQAREPSVFAMADAVIEGRARDAEELVARLLADGEPAQRLLAMIARQYRLLLLTKELLEQGVRGPEISTRLQVPGFALQRLLKQAPRHTIDGLRRAYRRLLEADLSVKRGVYDDETALDLLIFELATPGASPADGRPGYSRPPGDRAPAPPGPARGSSGR